MKQEILIKNKEENKNEKEQEQEKNSQFLTKKQNILVMLLIFIALFITFSIYWVYKNTGNVTLEQLIFHLKVPIKGTNVGMIFDYMLWTFSRILVIIFGVGLIIYFFEKKIKIELNKKKKILYSTSKVLLVASVLVVCGVMNVWGFAKNQLTASTLIGNEYINPATVNINFPEQKRNLIYIYLESIENTYTSVENGGMYKEDRISELRKIAQDNINFSNTNKLGGALDLKGTQWTIAAMVAQTSGVPLKISIGDNDYGKHSSFLPGAYTLGEILEENGYKNYLLIGSESEFGGRKQYFESHGNYKIWDYISALEEKRMEESQKVWWGYSDNDLFKYAKEQLTEISKNSQPFNYTMLTVDTHFTDGYKCEDCEEEFEDQYSNVINCSNKKVSEFIEWVQEQEFYDNTTIIISGDHLTMQAQIGEEAVRKGYGERSVYNAIINANAEPVQTTNRKFFTIDMYPTTLAALGAEIEGERLGLGTNLFSDKKTLAEQYGVEYVREELEKKSIFYNKKLVYNKLSTEK